MKQSALLFSALVLSVCNQAAPTTIQSVDVTLAPAATSSSTGASAAEQDAFEAAVVAWESAQIKSYEFVYIFNCECDPGWAGPWRVTVTEDVITNFVHDHGVARFNEPPQLAIADLFAKAQDALTRFPGNNTIEYDPEFGFPRSIVADLEAVAVDGGEALSVWEFIPAD